MRTVAAALLLGLLAGWWVNGLRLNAEIVEIYAAQDRARLKTIEKVRLIEQSWQNKVNEVSQRAEESIEIAVHDAALAGSAADRLRKELDRIKRQLPRCPTNPGSSEAAPSSIDVLTDVLSEMEAAGRGLAAEADKRRVAGLACETGWPSQ